MATEFKISCGSSSDPLNIVDQLGGFTLLATGEDGNTPVAWADNATLENGVGLDFSGDATLQIEWNGVDELPYGSYLEPMLLAIELVRPAAAVRQPLMFWSDFFSGSGVAIFIETDGTVKVQELTDGGGFYESTGTVPSGVRVELLLQRFNDTDGVFGSVDTGWVMQVNGGTIESLTRTTGSANYNFAALGENDPVYIGYMDFGGIPTYFTGDIGRFEFIRTEAFNDTSGPTDYTHVWAVCSVVDVDPPLEGVGGFWTNFVDTREQNTEFSTAYRLDDATTIEDGIAAGRAAGLLLDDPDDIQDDLATTVLTDFVTNRTLEAVGYFMGLVQIHDELAVTPYYPLTETGASRPATLSNAEYIATTFVESFLIAYLTAAGVSPWPTDPTVPFRYSGGSIFERTFNIYLDGAWAGAYAGYLDEEALTYPVPANAVPDYNPYAFDGVKSRTDYETAYATGYAALALILP